MKILTGTYEYFLDEKGRTRIPQAMKDILGENLYIGKGMGAFLTVYSEEALEETAKAAKEYQEIKTGSEEEIRLVSYYRDFFSDVEPFKSDNQKRYRIPKKLVDYAGLKGNIIIVGNNGLLEIWSPELFERRKELDVGFCRIRGRI